MGPDGVSTASFPHPFFGTSASTPHVAGAAALILAANPNFNVALLREELLRATNLIGRPAPNNEVGRGVVDLSKIQ